MSFDLDYKRLRQGAIGQPSISPGQPSFSLQPSHSRQPSMSTQPSSQASASMQPSSQPSLQPSPQPSDQLSVQPSSQPSSAKVDQNEECGTWATEGKCQSDPEYMLENCAASCESYTTDTEIIKTTCKIYGSIFLVLFVIFLFVRRRYPRVYNIKKSFRKLNTPVAEDAFGIISWIWKVFTVNYDDISEQCGMDAVTSIRLFEFGVKLSLVGILNSFFLFPVYKIAGDLIVGDPMKEVSLSNLPQQSPASIATTIAAYISFGAAMYFIDKDFDWFTSHRHNFLRKKRVQNYSVFMSGLPPQMQGDDGAITEYFSNCFSHDAVVDGDVALKIPRLEKQVAKREALLSKLEHAISVFTIKGETPRHKTKKCGGENVESIPTYTKELEELNKEISEAIDKIYAKSKIVDDDVKATGDDLKDTCVDRFFDAKAEADTNENAAPFNEETENENGREMGLAEEDSLLKQSTFAKSITRASALATDSARVGASIIKSIVIGGEDGATRTAAFVSFADLTSANLARQAVLHDEPWVLVPVEPPMPKLVNWKNVGKSNVAKQAGELISLTFTAVLCIFWTIPVSFVASLSNVEALTELIPPLQEPVEKWPWFSELLAQLAPLLLVAFISVLPYILLAFLKFEALIEIESMQHPSLFSKMAAFTIIQTFFISTIASTLFASIQEIINGDTTVRKTIELLAKALPAQAGYFIQIILVQNLLGMGIELLRISPAGQNFARKIVANLLGHNVTEEERNETFLGLRSLDDPLEYYFGRDLGSKVILVLMVLYVYGCMSPITNYFTLLVFGLFAMGFRNQFIYIYPIANDSGGKLWLNFTRISVTCMIIAEIILFVVLLLKAAFIAAMLLLPLIIGTILFDIYFKRRHYYVTSYLPLGDCEEQDSLDKSEGMTYEWLVDAYLQPALHPEMRVKWPKNYHEIDPGYLASGTENQDQDKELDEEDGGVVEAGSDEDAEGSPLYKVAP